jgi:hypothetical protein
MVAQGNALGKMIQKCLLVLKGQHKRAPLFCPFRANVLAIIVPRALPWATIVIALSARRNRRFSLLCRAGVLQCFQFRQIVSRIDVAGVQA